MLNNRNRERPPGWLAQQGVLDTCDHGPRVVRMHDWRGVPGLQCARGHNQAHADRIRAPGHRIHIGDAPPDKDDAFCTVGAADFNLDRGACLLTHAAAQAHPRQADVFNHRTDQHTGPVHARIDGGPARCCAPVPPPLLENRSETGSSCVIHCRYALPSSALWQYTTRAHAARTHGG